MAALATIIIAGIIFIRGTVLMLLAAAFLILDAFSFTSRMYSYAS
jgi:hypothetical protein